MPDRKKTTYKISIGGVVTQTQIPQSKLKEAETFKGECVEYLCGQIIKNPRKWLDKCDDEISKDTGNDKKEEN